MKIYLRNQNNFHEETVKFYKENFELVSEAEADVIVINDFEPIQTTKSVACNSTGIEHIKAPKIISLRGSDLDELTAVPELTIGMAIYLTRIFKREEIKDKILGIIGYGRIGRRLANYAKSLGMKIEIFDKQWSKNNLENLLQKADIIALCITADEENRNFINKDIFSKIKDGAIFLNPARDWLVENEGLKWALETKLSGAWMDFLTFPNCSDYGNLVCTDHLGGTTKESKKKTELIIAKKLKHEY